MELDQKEAFPPRVLNIVFSVPPWLILDVPHKLESGGRLPTDYRMPNSGALQLKYSAAENAEYLSYENWIAQSLVEIFGVSAEDGDVALAKDAISERLFRFWDNLDHLKHEEWCRQRISPGQSPRKSGQIVVFTSKLSVFQSVTWFSVKIAFALQPRSSKLGVCSSIVTDGGLLYNHRSPPFVLPGLTRSL